MKKAIIISGTPGTGKTTIAIMLEQKGFPVVYVNELIKENQLYTEIDEERDCVIVDDEKLLGTLNDLVKQNEHIHPLILEGHLAEVDQDLLLHCFVCRCSIRELRTRLEERSYSAGKIEENVQAEIMEEILNDMLFLFGEKYVSIIDTDGTKEKNVLEIVKIIEEKKEEMS